MKINTLRTTLLLIVSVLILHSCKQEGCTDKNASNYSSDADKDDGTCTYKGEVVFWYGESVSSYLTILQSNSLTFYVDGVIVGSTASSVYWTSAPSCNSNASITVEKDLGLVKSKESTYRVINEDGLTLWEGQVTFVANTCTTFQLTL